MRCGICESKESQGYIEYKNVKVAGCGDCLIREDNRIEREMVKGKLEEARRGAIVLWVFPVVIIILLVLLSYLG